MHDKIEEQGNYEMFESDHGHKIIVFNNGQNELAIVHGQQGDIAVYSDSKHTKSKTLQDGKFYFVDIEDDPDFRDVPHLFLQKGDDFDEIILPNGLPTESDPQKKVVQTDKRVDKQKLQSHLKKSS